MLYVVAPEACVPLPVGPDVGSETDFAAILKCAFKSSAIGILNPNFPAQHTISRINLHFATVHTIRRPNLFQGLRRISVL
jgi:hypothetical protein